MDSITPKHIIVINAANNETDLFHLNEQYLRQTNSYATEYDVLYKMQKYFISMFSLYILFFVHKESSIFFALQPRLAFHTFVFKTKLYYTFPIQNWLWDHKECANEVDTPK